jgi:uncharacterized Zn finger protein
MWYRDLYPRSRPRAAKGGIKAQSKRGRFGESWWAKRWIEVLESFDIGARLGRARSYARNGQVLSIDVEKGAVTAEVQGSRPDPYEVRIDLRVLSAADWKKLVKSLAGQALYTAKLLAGEMPQDIEKAFSDAGLSLFPERLKDLVTDCSCPDWSNPCKHIAAVYYLLGEEFDRDPFLLFRLRGLTREELCEHLGKASRPKKKKAVSEPQPEVPAGEPLAADPAGLWGLGKIPGDLLGEVQPPPVHAAWPKRLGKFPFWRGREQFLDALEPVYREASRHAAAALEGSSKSTKDELQSTR